MLHSVVYAENYIYTASTGSKEHIYNLQCITVPSNLKLIAAQTQSIKMNWRDGELNPKIVQHSAVFFPAFWPELECVFLENNKIDLREIFFRFFIRN